MFDRSYEEQYDELILCSPSEASFLLLLRTDANAISPDAAMAVGIGAQRAKRTLDAIEVKALARAACRPRDPKLPDEVARSSPPAPACIRRPRPIASRPPGRRCPAAARREGAGGRRDHVPAARSARPGHRRTVRRGSRRGRSRLRPRRNGRISRRLAAAIARIAPEHAKKKAEENRSQRTIDNWSDPAEGVAGFGLQGPLDLVALIKAAIDRQAKTREPGDCRSIGTRRFDVVLGWARSALGLDPSDERRPADVGAVVTRAAGPVRDCCRSTSPFR